MKDNQSLNNSERSENIENANKGTLLAKLQKKFQEHMTPVILESMSPEEKDFRNRIYHQITQRK
ncbi:MAG: hypothetical protein WCJ81_06555 [bacterium]